MQPLSVDTLRPLVDLANWSTFVEVRRDCAAAFATLSMNEANLDVLSQAGALGALLALVGVGNHKNDSQVHRDAATALSQLVKLDDIKLRLLKAPDGLKALFYMTRSSSVSVKRAATKTLLNLAAIDEAKQAVFAGSGIRSLLTLVNVKDEKTKRCAVKVIRRCTELEANRAAFMEPGTLHHNCTAHGHTRSCDASRSHRDHQSFVACQRAQENINGDGHSASASPACRFNAVNHTNVAAVH